MDQSKERANDTSREPSGEPSTVHIDPNADPDEGYSRIDSMLRGNIETDIEKAPTEDDKVRDFKELSDKGGSRSASRNRSENLNPAGSGSRTGYSEGGSQDTKSSQMDKSQRTRDSQGQGSGRQRSSGRGPESRRDDVERLDTGRSGGSQRLQRATIEEVEHMDVEQLGRTQDAEIKKFSSKTKKDTTEAKPRPRLKTLKKLEIPEDDCVHILSEKEMKRREQGRLLDGDTPTDPSHSSVACECESDCLMSDSPHDGHCECESDCLMSDDEDDGQRGKKKNERDGDGGDDGKQEGQGLVSKMIADMLFRSAGGDEADRERARREKEEKEKEGSSERQKSITQPKGLDKIFRELWARHERKMEKEGVDDKADAPKIVPLKPGEEPESDAKAGSRLDPNESSKHSRRSRKSKTSHYYSYEGEESYQSSRSSSMPGDEDLEERGSTAENEDKDATGGQDHRKSKKTKQEEDDSKKKYDTREIYVRDVGIQVCLSLLPDILELTQLTNYKLKKAFLPSKKTKDSSTKRRPQWKIGRPMSMFGDPPALNRPRQSAWNERGVVNNQREARPWSVAQMNSKRASISEKNKEIGRKSKSLSPNRKSKVVSNAGQKENKGDGPTPEDMHMALINPLLKGKVKKHILEAPPPYSTNIPIYSVEYPPPSMVHRGIQVDQDVDRFDILLAITDVKFNSKTGIPQLEGLTAKKDEEFPYVIVDRPTKCYCNNNENEPFVSKYVRMSDKKQRRRAVKIGRAHSRKHRAKWLKTLGPKPKMKSARSMPRIKKPFPTRAKSPANSYDYGRHSALRSRHTPTESTSGSLIVDEPLNKYESTSQHSADSTGDFSASIVAPTKSSLAKSGQDKFQPCNTRPCTPRIHRSFHMKNEHQQPSNHFQQDVDDYHPYSDIAYTEFDDSNMLHDRNQEVMYDESTGSFGYSHERRHSRLPSVQSLDRRSRPSPKRPKRTPNCPGPVRAYRQTMSKRTRISENGKGRVKYSRRRDYDGSGSQSTEDIVKGPSKKRYTDIRMKHCDIIKKPNFGEKEYEYMRKDGRLKSKWKEAKDKNRKEGDNKGSDSEVDKTGSTGGSQSMRSGSSVSTEGEGESEDSQGNSRTSKAVSEFESDLNNEDGEGGSKDTLEFSKEAEGEERSQSESQMLASKSIGGSQSTVAESRGGSAIASRTDASRSAANSGTLKASSADQERERRTKSASSSKMSRSVENESNGVEVINLAENEMKSLSAPKSRNTASGSKSGSQSITKSSQRKSGSKGPTSLSASRSQDGSQLSNSRLSKSRDASGSKASQIIASGSKQSNMTLDLSQEKRSGSKQGSQANSEVSQRSKTSSIMASGTKNGFMSKSGSKSIDRSGSKSRTSSMGLSKSMSKGTSMSKNGSLSRGASKMEGSAQNISKQSKSQSKISASKSSSLRPSTTATTSSKFSQESRKSGNSSSTSGMRTGFSITSSSSTSEVTPSGEQGDQTLTSAANKSNSANQLTPNTTFTSKSRGSSQNSRTTKDPSSKSKNISSKARTSSALSTGSKSGSNIENRNKSDEKAEDFVLSKDSSGSTTSSSASNGPDGSSAAKTMTSEVPSKTESLSTAATDYLGPDDKDDDAGMTLTATGISMGKSSKASDSTSFDFATTTSAGSKSKKS
ncbi:uncharacterized protein LOC142338371 isoform X2 [Convolutriloba macropyga]